MGSWSERIEAAGPALFCAGDLMMPGEFRKFNRRQNAQELLCELYLALMREAYPDDDSNPKGSQEKSDDDE